MRIGRDGCCCLVIASGHRAFFSGAFADIPHIVARRSILISDCQQCVSAGHGLITARRKWEAAIFVRFLQTTELRIDSLGITPTSLCCGFQYDT